MLIPETATGRPCGARVEQGMIAYRCTLSDGHHHLGEPHYAVEVERSVRVWRKWAEQKAREEATKEAFREVENEDPAPEEDEQDRLEEARRLSDKSLSDLSSFVSENSPRSFEANLDGPLPVEDEPSSEFSASTKVDLLRQISTRAEQNLAKDPSLSVTLALWLAAEQITRRGRP